MRFNNILSLDQASTCSGYSIFVDNELVKYGTIDLSDIDSDTNGWDKMDEKINNVKHIMMKFVKEYNINLVILEGVQKQTNVETFKNLSGLQTVLKNTLYDSGVPYAVLKPSEWRKALNINKGKQTRSEAKKRAKKYALDTFGIDATEDECDSVCIGQAGIILLNKNKLSIHDYVYGGDMDKVVIHKTFEEILDLKLKDAIKYFNDIKYSKEDIMDMLDEHNIEYKKSWKKDKLIEVLLNNNWRI